MQPALLTCHTKKAFLRNNDNPQVVPKKRVYCSILSLFLSGCFGISVFPFSPWMRLCHFEEGVSLSGSSGDEPTAGSSSRMPFFCGLGVGEKQQSVLVSHSSLALIVSTFLQRRGAWLGGRNAHGTRVCNE